mgnify:CR=1 FL=1
MKTLALLAAAMLVSTAVAQAGTILDLKAKDIEGKETAMSAYKGKVSLVVNVASKCGFTPQYRELEAIWRKYKDRGFVVLGVPSNDFGEQEPNGSAEIKKFCQGAFGVTFPLTEKQVVIGPKAHAFYHWATSASGGAPAWNFHKYLIGRDGRMIQSFSSKVTPTSPELTEWIEKALAETAPAAPS